MNIYRPAQDPCCPPPCVPACCCPVPVPGPTGVTGATGPTGPTGPTGATGATGTAATPELLSAYSTPSAPGSSDTLLEFDQNGPIVGTNITHTPGSTDFTILTPGIYSAAFHGNIAPASGVSFPMNILLSLQLNGSGVPGASAQHTFSTSSDTATVSFSFPVQVTQASSTIQVIAQGGNFIYSAASLTLTKLA